MWKKDGKLVFPSSDTAVDIQEYGRTLVVSQARLEDTGAWTCVATVGQLGRDSLDYQASVLHSHWSTSNEAWLSLVESFIVLLVLVALLCHKVTYRRSKEPKASLSECSLWHKNRWLPFAAH